MFGVSTQGPPDQRRRGSDALKPVIEGLEQRLLLYSTLGGEWAYGSRITYSFAPDGTNVSGQSNQLAQAMASQGISESQWKYALRRAAAVWQAAANINLTEVPDSGNALGVSGNQQNDSRFGDVRFFATPKDTSILGQVYLPPPFNGGTRAGDVVLNSETSWNIGSTFDLQTVAIHEIGHALGVGHSTYSDAAMYDSYNGVKQSLSPDDISGIRAIYGPRQQDWIDQFHDNKDPWNAVNISGLIGSDRKVTLPNLDVTSNYDSDWYYVQAPSNASGEMTITMQSKDLSSLSPRFQVYNAALQFVGWTVSPDPGAVFGSTISLRFTGVPAGTGVFIKAMGWNGQSSGVNGIGAYALQVDFSGDPIPSAIVSPPNTTVAEMPDQGGGTINQVVAAAEEGGGAFFNIAAPPPTPIGFASRFDTRNPGWPDQPLTRANYGTVAFTHPGRREIGRLPMWVRPLHAGPKWVIPAIDMVLNDPDLSNEISGGSSRRGRSIDDLLDDFVEGRSRVPEVRVSA